MRLLDADETDQALAQPEQSADPPWQRAHVEDGSCPELGILRRTIRQSDDDDVCPVRPGRDASASETSCGCGVPLRGEGPHGERPVPRVEAGRRALLVYTSYLGYAVLAQAAPRSLPRGARQRRELQATMLAAALADG